MGYCWTSPYTHWIQTSTAEGWGGGDLTYPLSKWFQNLLHFSIVTHIGSVHRNDSISSGSSWTRRIKGLRIFNIFTTKREIVKLGISLFCRPESVAEHLCFTTFPLNLTIHRRLDPIRPREETNYVFNLPTIILYLVNRRPQLPYNNATVHYRERPFLKVQSQPTGELCLYLRQSTPGWTGGVLQYDDIPTWLQVTYVTILQLYIYLYTTRHIYI